MTNSRKGRGPRRSSIAPPYRLRRSVPPPDVVRTRDKARETIPKESKNVEAENRIGASGIDERESAQIDGSIRRSIEDLVSPPPSSPFRTPSNDRPSDKGERWDEPGSRAETETATSMSKDRSADETSTASRDETATATHSQAPKRAVDDSTTADFFSKSTEHAAPERLREQSTNTWDSEYDSMSASRGSKKASYTIYAVLGVVLVALGGLYLYGGPDERPKRSSTSPVQPEEGKPAPVLKPAVSQAIDRIEPNPPEAEDNKFDKKRETTRTDPDPEQVEIKIVAANTPKETSEESSSQINADQAGSKITADGECCGSIDKYQEALRLNPNDTDILAKLAYFYLNKGMNPEARRFAERTVNIDPKSSTGWIVLGAAFDALNDHEAALEAYTTCAQQTVGKYVMECRNLVRERR